MTASDPVADMHAFLLHVAESLGWLAGDRMGAFYVNCCVKGSDQSDILALLSRNRRAGYVGPTVDGWTALVTEDLEAQDNSVIQDYGRALTRGSDNVAIVFVCHDEDVLMVDLFLRGEVAGSFNSDPAYFYDPGEFDPDTMTFSKPPPTEEESKPVLHGAEAFADAFGLDEATISGLLPQVGGDAAQSSSGSIIPDQATDETGLDQALPEGPIELHERWSATLGLPAYAVGMGFKYVEQGESNVDWARA